ncbi:Gamma-aminobutyric acid type B receptor subunit 2 [Holothuria leucospilota]|uniref:Gamma-aminobutyric acid type B receptor subunit 2 n=1 Tax=Holothuria leucospilota TaxID=206669 RepID=A0A9Q1CGA1_HOLLE|nr:Gamma-aminobutyric acid type B receptor subunit 2 [Holothuria leucospilota]
MMSMSGEWDGSGCLVAAELALEQINNRTDILPDYELIMPWNDTQVLYSATSNTLTDRVKYPNVYRTVPIATNTFNSPYIWLLRTYGWKKVGFLSDSDASFTAVSLEFYLSMFFPSSRHMVYLFLCSSRISSVSEMQVKIVLKVNGEN